MGGVYKYFMTVKVISGCVRSSLVLDIVKALKSGSGAECHVYKVVGENTIVGVVNDQIEIILNELNRLDGHLDIISTPLRAYENFAKDVLGVVADGLCDVVPVQLVQEGRQIFWLDISIEYKGLSVDEFLSNWRREAETVLGARKAGQLDIEVYKVIAERKVEALISVPDGDSLDVAAFNLPLMKSMGDNVTIQCKALQLM